MQGSVLYTVLDNNLLHVSCKVCKLYLVSYFKAVIGMIIPSSFHQFQNMFYVKNTSLKRPNVY